MCYNFLWSGNPASNFLVSTGFSGFRQGSRYSQLIFGMVIIFSDGHPSFPNRWKWFWIDLFWYIFITYSLTYLFELSWIDLLHPGHVEDEALPYADCVNCRRVGGCYVCPVGFDGKLLRWRGDAVEPRNSGPQHLVGFHVRDGSLSFSHDTLELAPNREFFNAYARSYRKSIHKNASTERSIFWIDLSHLQLHSWTSLQRVFLLTNIRYWPFKLQLWVLGRVFTVFYSQLSIYKFPSQKSTEFPSGYVHRAVNELELTSSK